MLHVVFEIETNAKLQNMLATLDHSLKVFANTNPAWPVIAGASTMRTIPI